MSFRLLSHYPDLKPSGKKAALHEFKGKPTVLHLYTG